MPMSMMLRISKIRQYLNNDVTTILPAYTFNGEQYVKLSQAEYLVRCLKDIERLANGRNLEASTD